MTEPTTGPTTRPTTGLNNQARQILAEAGITEAEWIAYGGWLDEVTDEAGGRRWVPSAEWHGDACGCDDDRCIGYHHDAGEECGCLPVLIEKRAQDHEAYAIWQDYRTAVEANDGAGDQAARAAAAASRAEAWVRRNCPYALSSALDVVVKGKRGISATFPALRDGSIPDYVGVVAEGDGYRQLMWTEGTTPDGRMSREDQPGPGPAPDLSEYDTLPHDAFEWFLSDHPWAQAERERRRQAHFTSEQQLAGEVQAWTEKIDRLQPGSTSPEFEQTVRRLAATLRPTADASQLRTQVRSAEPDELAVQEERRRLAIRRRNEGDDAYEYPAYLTGPGAAMFPPPASGFRAAEQHT